MVQRLQTVAGYKNIKRGDIDAAGGGCEIASYASSTMMMVNHDDDHDHDHEDHDDDAVIRGVSFPPA